jgi:hypothetical protein
MEPLQLIALIVAGDNARGRAREALPDAPRIPYEPRVARTPVVRAHLAGLLRRTADHVDPCPAPSAG